MLGILLAISAALAWGTGAIFTRLGLRPVKAATGTLVSMFASLSLISFFALALNFEDIRQIAPATLLWFSLIGVINYVLGRQFNYTSIKYIGVTRATPLFAAAPLFAITLAVSLTGEQINPAIIAGTLGVLAGLYLVITSEGTEEQKISSHQRTIAGIAFGIAAALAYGVSSVLIRRGTTTMTPPLVGATIAMLAGTLVLLAFQAHELKPALSGNRKATGFLLLSGVATGIGVLSSFFALSQAPVVIVSPIQSTSPLFALIWSTLFLKRLEKITPRLITGSTLVVLGIVLIAINRTT